MDPKPVLKRFQQRFFKKNAQGSVIPAAGAIVKFFGQGATVTIAASVPDSSGLLDPIVKCVHVYHVGTVVAGEQLQLGYSEQSWLIVMQVDADNATIYVYNNSGHTISVPAGIRLVRRSSPMGVYSNPIGSGSAGNSRTADADGWVECYVRDYRYDLTVQNIPIPEVHLDAVGSWVMR